MADHKNISYYKLVDYLVPALLAGTVYFLSQISSEIKDLGQKMAVSTERQNEFERRLEILEKYPPRP